MALRDCPIAEAGAYRGWMPTGNRDAPVNSQNEARGATRPAPEFARTKCPHCGSGLKYREDTRAALAACPACGNSVPIAARPIRSTNSETETRKPKRSWPLASAFWREISALGREFGSTPTQRSSATDVIFVPLFWLYRVVKTAVSRLLKVHRLKKGIVSAAAVAFVLAGLFPPWLYTYYSTGSGGRFSYEPGGHSERNAGYHFIFTPPPPREGEIQYGIKLDMPRVLIEWACIAAISGAALFLLGSVKAQQPDEKPQPKHTDNS